MEYTLNIRGRLMDLSHPQVMGIINVTPDSFYEGSRKQTEREIAMRAEEILAQGGSMIDIGAFSTRPGAYEVSEEEEGRRLRWALDIVRREVPDAVVSVDTYRPTLARRCINDWGADIINDVSEGGLTGIVNTPIHEAENMFDVVGELKCPYILMSVKPTLGEMMKAFAGKIQQLRDRGAKDIILDPGFCFGKTLEQNYELMAGRTAGTPSARSGGHIAQDDDMEAHRGYSRHISARHYSPPRTGGGTRRLDTTRPRCGRGSADRGGGRENEAITNQRSYITCFLILA